MTAPGFVTLAGLPTGPDAHEAWIKLDLLTRRVVGRRLEEGPTVAMDEALDALMVLRRVDSAEDGQLAAAGDHREE